ncbi:TIGR03620 family F420-dependent LLM class oxidoreductase [Solihabitans fulvus]|uniref:TIGR03620 family F420-dependent LLM class oxidoreductase n=1 Tax=Solihabitans fulvus TaxID=1892852 RepID=UPI00166204C5|nr:TIGR03620 family F420-dependent LLM class oxidoreductase [Solihabitans fulvus]
MRTAGKTDRRLRLGSTGIWAGSADSLPAVALRQAAVAVEDLGYRTLWLQEATGREAMAQAGILLSATRRIVLATGSADIYARDAVTTAAAQGTLDEAFPGRFLLGLWGSHPSLAEDVRGHRFGPPVETMRAYLDALDTAPFGPPAATASPHRVLSALDPAMLALAGERAWGAHVLGMPVEHTRTARAVLGPDALLTVTQFCVLHPNRAQAAELARSVATAALPNRHGLLRDLGYADAIDDRLVAALVAAGSAADVAERVEEHRAAGADHVSLHVVTATPSAPPIEQWRDLAAHLPLD